MWRSGFKRISIVTRILLAGCLSLVLFATAMLIFIKNDLERAIYSETDARVQVAQNTIGELLRARGAATLTDGQLRFGGWLANGDNSLVDHVRLLTGADATLFAILDGKPIRVATTILKLDGSARIVGTELVGPARAAFDRGRSFAGVSPVAGRPYLNRYDTLRDVTGRTIGIVYTGIPLTTLTRTVARAMRTVLLGTAVALLASLSLLYVVMRPLRRAFRNAVTMAQGLAGGDVEQHSDVVSDDELGKVSRAFRQMITYQQRMAAIADALADGDFSTKVIPVSPRDRLGVAFAHMSEKLKELVQQLERTAMTDTLTQLGNRRAFDACMRSELSRAARSGGEVWLALVDVDDFKTVNDDNGHQYGDVVLSRLGFVLRRTRAEDSAYRLGGDEFAVVFSDCSGDEARLALERIREETQTDLFGTTVSIGLAGSPRGSIDAATLQRHADAALYVCKQRGRNIVVSFDEVRSSGGLTPHVNIAAVTNLIAERQLLVVFQPIWDIERGAIMGFEALARPDAKYGLSGPQEAFDVAAKIGSAHSLDRVCREAAIAQAQGLPATALLFLNVLSETLARGELDAQTLAAALMAVGIAAPRVVLEMTDRCAGPHEPAIAAARELQRFGFKLALAQAGTGNAGLEYLSRSEAEFIKIDRTVVANAPRDSAARGVIAAIVALAKTTNAYVIAEGVEDRTMLDAVRTSQLEGVVNANAVSGVQGYLLGRPGLIGAATNAAETTRLLLREPAAGVFSPPLPLML